MTQRDFVGVLGICFCWSSSLKKTCTVDNYEVLVLMSPPQTLYIYMLYIIIYIYIYDYMIICFMFMPTTTVHQAISFNMDHGKKKHGPCLTSVPFRNSQEDCTSMAVPQSAVRGHVATVLWSL